MPTNGFSIEPQAKLLAQARTNFLSEAKEMRGTRSLGWLLGSNPSGAATQALCGRRRARELRAGLGFWKLWELGVWRWRGGDLLGLGSGQLCVCVCVFLVFLLFFPGGGCFGFSVACFHLVSHEDLLLRVLASESIRSTCRAKEKLFSTVQAWTCQILAKRQLQGSKSRLPPSEHPNPPKIGSKMGGEFTYPKMAPLVLTHSHMFGQTKREQESEHGCANQFSRGHPPPPKRRRGFGVSRLVSM